MTPGYVAPELISDMGTYVAPTKASDIYSFAILSYEVAFCCDPWPKVSMQLIESVRKGYRPVIPSDAPKFMSAIVQECWQHESSSRPHASQVSHLINEHLDKFTSGNIHVNANDAHDTEVLEGNTFSVSNDEANFNLISTLSVTELESSDSCDDWQTNQLLVLSCKVPLRMRAISVHLTVYSHYQRMLTQTQVMIWWWWILHLQVILHLIVRGVCQAATYKSPMLLKECRMSLAIP